MAGTHSQYPVSVRWVGARRAAASSADGLPDLSVGPPPAFGGTAGLWTPEHLFVLAATSCWLTTFLAVAASSKLDFVAVECSGNGTLEQGEDRRFRISAIALRPRVTVARGEDGDLAIRLVQKAESICLIRNSMRSEVTMEPEILVAADSPVPA